jgi:hypothetical protein
MFVMSQAKIWPKRGKKGNYMTFLTNMTVLKEDYRV